MKRIFTIGITIFLSVFLFGQDPGDLDINFGIDGILNISWPDKNTDMYSMSIQSTGKIILAGNIEDQITNEEDFLAVRLTENGLIDFFGNQGDHFSEDLTPYENLSTSCILPDDKIILGGSFSVAGDPIIYQLLPNGELDLSFSGDGSYTYVGHTLYPLDINSFSTTEGYNILASGFGESNTPELMMIDQDGSRVSTFGVDGVYQIAGITGPIVSFAIDITESICYGCIIDYTSGGAMYVSKHDLLTGDLIPSFGTNGVLEILPFGDAVVFLPQSITIEPDMDKLTIIGHYYHTAGDNDLFAVRLNASDGSIDPTFGLSGWSTLRIAGASETVTTAIRQSDGMFYIGGYTNFINPMDFMVCRISNNGVLDTEFGDGGFTIVNVDEGDFISDLVLSPGEERLYCGGAAYPTSDHYISVISLYTGYTSVGIPEENIPEVVKIYPNPAKCLLNIELKDAKDLEIIISDLSGKKVLARHMDSDQSKVDVSHLSRGIYFISLARDGKAIRPRKFLKH